jgi:hypothetical protein
MVFQRVEPMRVVKRQRPQAFVAEKAISALWV